MLIELWEKFRGYDNWIQVSARIESSDVEKTPHYGRDGSVSYTWASGDELAWTDREGQRRSSEFKVDDESPLYQLVSGENVTIRYNPANPDEFYYRDLLRSRVNFFFRMTLLTGMLSLFLLLIFGFGFFFGR